jgi:hypothetical protein
MLINDIPKEELDRLLDPVNFQEWMLFFGEKSSDPLTRK